MQIHNRGNAFSISGPDKNTEAAGNLLINLYKEATREDSLSPDTVHLFLQQSDLELRMQESAANIGDNGNNVENFTVIRTKKGNIRPRGLNQQRYVRAIQTHDINFGVGPAGTGKTYLAVACAVESLLRDEVERILLVRPAVEAGEKL